MRIEVKDLTKRFDHTIVLDRINLEIRQKEFLGLLGPSGSGKTTLLRIIARLEFADSGVVEVDGRDVGTLGFEERKFGFVFQQYHLLDDLTVYENLEIPLSYRKVGKNERSAMVADTLDRFQIVAKRDLYPRQLSGGQQQLVGVARAIISSPKLILADEPTGNLHSSQGEEIMVLFQKLNREGTTIIQVTHSEKNASYGNRVIQLRDGWVVNQ